MEFKFGSIDNLPSTHHRPSSSSINYFAGPAIRPDCRMQMSKRGSNCTAGYSSTNNGQSIQDHELMRNPIISTREPMYREFQTIDYHEVMQREIDKQRIREKIEAEIAYERMLEEEVRREILMERYQNMRRSDGLLMNNFERKSNEAVPFQRNCGPLITENKPQEKVMYLPKPDSNLCGTKRKSITPPTIGFGKPSLKTPKKKLKEEWLCPICEISTTSDQALREHRSGKKHKANEVRVKQQLAGQNIDLGVNNCEVKSLPPKKSEVEEKSKNKQSAGDSSTKVGGKSKKNTLKFLCEMCNVRTHSMKVMNRHKKGKKHLYKLECIKNRSDSTVKGGSENCRETSCSEIKEEQVDEVGVGR